MALCHYLKGCFIRQFSVCSQCRSNKSLDKYVSKKNQVYAPADKMKDINLRTKQDNVMVWDETRDVNIHVNAVKMNLADKELGNPRERYLLTAQSLRQMIIYKGVFSEKMARNRVRLKRMRQMYIQKRVDVLGPDIAVAHFILNRGGSVKFFGNNDWIGIHHERAKIPTKYVPGLYIEGIDAYDTDLYYEGVDCLRNLNKLTWLSLRGLVNLCDFSLDVISGRYGTQLEYLDLTGCKNITHYGLSCFHRFKCLKVLNVSDMEHSPEFKLSCLMIHDLLPELDIVGIDYSKYVKDDYQNENENKTEEEKQETLTIH